MEKKQPTNKIKAKNELTKELTVPLEKTKPDSAENKELVQAEAKTSDINNSESIQKSKKPPDVKSEAAKTIKKPIKPPKIEDKPFDEFVVNHLIPCLKSSLEEKGVSVYELKLIEGQRPVVGGKCWMVFCEISNQRRFWLCFNKEAITSDKTILLSESDSKPSIVESFLIDEKKTTLALLISRVLQRLNGQKWFGAN